MFSCFILLLFNIPFNFRPNILKRTLGVHISRANDVEFQPLGKTL